MIGKVLRWAAKLLRLEAPPPEPEQAELYLDRKGETLKDRTGKAATMTEPGRVFLPGKEALQLSKTDRDQFLEVKEIES